MRLQIILTAGKTAKVGVFMKKGKLVLMGMSVFVLMFALAFIGCETDSGSDYDDTPTVSVDSDLIGTWNCTRYDGADSSAAELALTFTANSLTITGTKKSEFEIELLGILGSGIFEFRGTSSEGDEIRVGKQGSAGYTTADYIVAGGTLTIENDYVFAKQGG